MLGKHVNVEIYGHVSSKGIYSGYVTDKEYNNLPVYVVSHKKIGNTIKAVIIAHTVGKTKYIAAPCEDFIFYEPELKQLFSSVSSMNTQSIRCYYEKSCGGIVYHIKDSTAYILLVKNRKGKYWSFPKGHIEYGESEHKTAAREIFEETGLKVHFIDGFREISEYIPFSHTKKRVVFFLAKASSEDVVIQPKEIDDYVWVNIDDAKKMCCYRNDLKILDKAEPMIRKLASYQKL